MDRYTFLFLINLPFIIFGILRAFAMYKVSITTITGLLSRLVFWLLIAAALGFSNSIYAWLYDNGLVNAKEISLTVVVLATGIIFSLFLIIRVYAKVEAVEKRQTELLTKLSILNSEKINKD
jgi:hypothetical protein